MVMGYGVASSNGSLMTIVDRFTYPVWFVLDATFGFAVLIGILYCKSTAYSLYDD